MKSSYKAKVVYFRDLKEFDCGEGWTTSDLSMALSHYEFYSDESIIKEFDDEYIEQAEIWKVKITVETVE
jgi:hypothetical protein